MSLCSVPFTQPLWDTCSACLRFLHFPHLSRYHAQLEQAGLQFQQTAAYLKNCVLAHLQTLELWWRLWTSQAGTGQDPCWLTEAGGGLLVSHLPSTRARLPWSEWHTLNHQQEEIKTWGQTAAAEHHWLLASTTLGELDNGSRTQSLVCAKMHSIKKFLVWWDQTTEKDNNVLESPTSRC